MIFTFVMPISSGTKLGRYEIRAKIGEGGMGEVYLALDSELDRTVAIKILPEAFASDKQRLQRFIQEAKAASAFAPLVVLKPGTRLVREWHGRAHAVIVLEDGFEYQGRRYPSLSWIATLITGTRWSGPVFFGLKPRKAHRARASGEADAAV